MKRLLLLMTLWGGLHAALASDYPYMAISLKDGQETVLKSDGLSFKVTDGKFIATNGEGSVAFAPADLATLRFAQTPSALTDVAAAPAAEVTVYTPSGILVGMYASEAEAAAAVRATGIYVLKCGKECKKLAIRK